MKWIAYLANPDRFSRFNRYALPLCVLSAIFLTSIGLGWGLFYAPADYLQGDAARILFIHVPSAWLSLFIYIGVTLSAVIFWVWRHNLADIAAQEMALIGTVFTLISLVTGAIWGKPSWGVYWVWDIRLVSQLLLLMIYLGILMLRQSQTDAAAAARFVAMLALAGLINIFIVKYSVEIWNSQHQGPSVITSEGSKIHASMLWPLMVTAFGFHFIFFSLLLTRMQTQLLNRRWSRLLTPQEKL